MGVDEQDSPPIIADEVDELLQRDDHADNERRKPHL